MKIPNLLFRATCFALAAVSLTLPKIARADTYQLYDLATAEKNGLLGIDASGAVVIAVPVFTHTVDFLYETFVNGVVTSTSTTAPTITYDNGTSCTPTSAPGVVSTGYASRCNNGYEVYEASYPVAGGQEFRGIFTGADLSDLLTSNVPGVVGSSFDDVFLNSSGDFVWIDGAGEQIFEAVDLTVSPVPESGSLLLCVTGLAGLAGTLRRRCLN